MTIPELNSDSINLLHELNKTFIPNDSIESIQKKFQLELSSRLQSSSNSMLPSHHLPDIAFNTLPSLTGSSSDNKLLTIDFGGTTLKFALLSQMNNDFVIELQKQYDLVDKNVDFNFFNNIIKWIIYECININLSKNTNFLVSTTFSFPLDSKKRIVTMGKGFVLSKELQNISITDILQNSFDKILKFDPFIKENFNFTAKINAVINDAVAVYLSNKFLSSTNSSFSNISLILGTGINSSFEIPFSTLPSFKKKSLANYLNSNDSILLNAEIGFLGMEVINLTIFDHFNNSSNGYDMPLEYVTSGKYLSLILQKIIRHFNILNDETFINNLDGEIFSNILSMNYDSINLNIDKDIQYLITEISKILIKRASIYVVAALFAINEFILQISNKSINTYSELSDSSDSESINSTNLLDNDKINVGYVGSFLAYSEYYHEQIKFYSTDRINLQFLNNSNLIGAAVATFLSNSIASK